MCPYSGDMEGDKMSESPSQIGWSLVTPDVNSASEFREIAADFGDPLEMLREAISNSMDAGATEMHVSFMVESVAGARRLVVRMTDNGCGMDRETLSRHFWGLGHSTSREDPRKIGEKGHGTKTYLRSEQIHVRTQKEGKACEAICNTPMTMLHANKLHEVHVREMEPFLDGHNGTSITLIGYNDNKRADFTQDNVTDFVLWRTKVGSIEPIFGIQPRQAFRFFLRCFDETERELPYGHPFPPQTPPIAELFAQFPLDASQRFVKRFPFPSIALHDHPEVRFDAIYSVEGDLAKRSYNPMICERRRAIAPGEPTHKYRVGDRYGLWICKDFIPVVRKNNWIRSFGEGSNAYVLLHAFVNCQQLLLTANRGDIANTEPALLAELEASVARQVEEVDQALKNADYHVLRGLEDEHHTVQQDRAEFERRKREVRRRRFLAYNGSYLWEPRNEAELYTLFVILTCLHNDLVDFKLVDYNTRASIDALAVPTSSNCNADEQCFFVEFKKLLERDVNHTLRFLRYLVCWDISQAVLDGTAVEGIEEGDRRLLEREEADGIPSYFLKKPGDRVRIEVIRLKELMKRKLDLEFE
ncbi:MAG: ATP-binding protein [Candidatus Brocadiia bacterium]